MTSAGSQNERWVVVGIVDLETKNFELCKTEPLKGNYIEINVHKDLLKSQKNPKEKSEEALLKIYMDKFSKRVLAMARESRDKGKDFPESIYVFKSPDADGTVHIESDYKNGRGLKTEHETLKLDPDTNKELQELTGKPFIGRMRDNFKRRKHDGT